MRKYEGMFIIKAGMDQKDEEKTVEYIKKSITKHKGNVVSADIWGKRQLAYPINGCKEGVYYRFDFEAEPSSIPALKKDSKLNEDIIRETIIVKE